MMDGLWPRLTPWGCELWEERKGEDKHSAFLKFVKRALGDVVNSNEVTVFNEMRMYTGKVVC